MFRALYSAATGMLAQQTQIDTTSNNIANVNTIGYRKLRAEFADLMYQTTEYAGTATSATTNSPTGIQVGLGVRPTAITKIHSQGNFQETGNSLDMAITGNGFFQIELPDGTIAYSRNGAFKMNQDGQVVNSDGYKLIPEVVIPEDTTDIKIGTDGIVTIIQAGQTESQQIAQIELANFVNPAGLHGLGDNLLLNTDASGDPIIATPGLDGLGNIREGFVEMSNVQLVVELTDLITGQRAYEANSKAITTSDEMLQTVNGLKR
jgi:flagellar basal-body rod protein FlgG